MHPCAIRLQCRNLNFEVCQAENDTEEIKALPVFGHKRAREKLFDNLQMHAVISATRQHF